MAGARVHRRSRERARSAARRGRGVSSNRLGVDGTGSVRLQGAVRRGRLEGRLIEAVGPMLAAGRMEVVRRCRYHLRWCGSGVRLHPTTVTGVTRRRAIQRPAIRRRGIRLRQHLIIQPRRIRPRAAAEAATRLVVEGVTGSDLGFGWIS